MSGYAGAVSGHLPDPGAWALAWADVSARTGKAIAELQRVKRLQPDRVDYASDADYCEAAGEWMQACLSASILMGHRMDEMFQMGLAEKWGREH